MRNFKDIILEKLRVSKSVDNYDSSIVEEYDKFIEEEWTYKNDGYSLTFTKQGNIPEIFKLSLKDPNTYYNKFIFNVKFAYNSESMKTNNPKVMFIFDNNRTSDRRIGLFIDVERTRLANLDNIYDIEDFLKHDFYEELKIDTVDGFISSLKEAMRFYLSPTSKGNTMSIAW
jgi:hypothetical protein